MPAWLEKTVSIGDILTIFSILIAAFGAITAWRTEIETRQRTQAEAVRKAAAEVIAKTERRFEISEWIFEDIQPDIISATILAASKDLPPGVSVRSLSARPGSVRSASVVPSHASRLFFSEVIQERRTPAAIPLLRVSYPRGISGDASVPVASEYGTASMWHFGEDFR
jgi:hypothetical protein